MLVSVVVPVYKVEDYLATCIESIRNQTYKNLEIILVDDGSPDHCGAICDSYAEKDSRIQVIHQQNQGLSGARNSGIDAATGEYIVFVDSDDYIAFDMIEILLQRLIKDGSDMAVCNFLYVDEEGQHLSKMNELLPIEDGILNVEEVFYRLAVSHKYYYYVTAVNKLYKKSIFDSVRFLAGKHYEDEFSIHHILQQCASVSCVATPLYFYVQRQGSIINTKPSIRNLEAVEAYLDRVCFFWNRKLYFEAACINKKAMGFLALFRYQLDWKNPDVRKQVKLHRKQVRSYITKLWFRNIGAKNRLLSLVFVIGLRPYYCIYQWYSRKMNAGN